MLVWLLKKFWSCGRGCWTYQQFGFVEILFFVCNSLILCGSQEDDPLSPPEGEAACGEHPPAPSFVKVFHQPSDDYRNIGGYLSGGEGSTM